MEFKGLEVTERTAQETSIYSQEVGFIGSLHGVLKVLNIVFFDEDPDLKSIQQGLLTSLDEVVVQTLKP